LKLPRLGNLVLTAASTVVFVAMALILDRTVAARLCGLSHSLPSTAGFIFPPRTVVDYSTPECQFRASINSLGFRDREFSVSRSPGVLRVVAIGDSFTYGWGVAQSLPWPKLLESVLGREGYSVEIANLGKPGASPRDYAELAAKAIPILKPDIVIVAILQCEDLMQLKFERRIGAVFAGTPSLHRPSMKKKAAETLRWLSLHLFPYTNLLIQQWIIHGDVSLSGRSADGWIAQAKFFLSRLDAAQRARFDQLDPRIKRLFVAGLLNPALISRSMVEPDFWLGCLNPEPQVVEELKGHLRRIDEICRAEGAQLLVVSVPNGEFVDPARLTASGTLGFHVDPQMLVTPRADDAVQEACDSVGIRFVRLTSEFRSAAAAGARFYFELDGHLNERGQQYFAELLAPRVAETIRKHPE
jgi:lysophospholipase L1-like esterase